MFGAVGDDNRLEYTVIGDAVNLCAKLEKHNKACGRRALTTREAYDLAVRQGYAPRAAAESGDPVWRPGHNASSGDLIRGPHDNAL